MPSEVFWSLFGSGITIAVALLGIYVAQQTGLLQSWIMKKAHDLNVTKAFPRIGSNIRTEYRHDNGPAYPRTIYLFTTIYNEGELPVSELNGQWKLTAKQFLSDNVIPIRRDFLGPTQYELEPYKILESGNQANNQFIFDVDIDFDYISPAHSEPQHYHAKYSYDRQYQRMNRSD